MKEIKLFSEILSEEAVTTAAIDVRQPVMTKTPLRRKELEEQNDIPNLDKSLGKMRHGMPQIKDWDAFTKNIEELGEKIEDVELTPSDLTPTQKNFNDEKVQRIIDDKKDFAPIVVSKDGFVIDGHHRWLAAHRMGQNVKCRQVSMSADDILEMCQGADYIEKKRIDERKD